MARDRPTFSEFWYRVADLHPRLVPAVGVRKQRFRGKTWHVLYDPANNDFFRLGRAAYWFVGLLDGHRAVSEAWKTTNERFGDEAPTQGEAINLMGQLYQANLLHAELPPDTQGMFKRFKKRRKREIQGRLMNFLFPRFPVWDPDSFLNRWVGAVGWLFSCKGLILWLAAMTAAFYVLAGRWGEMARNAQGILSRSNLPLLYCAFVLAKAAHEAAHAFSCKHFGRREGGTGQVHEVGIMLLVLTTPAPYVDASSAWRLRRKRHRLTIGAAGIMAELVLASVAAIVWTQSNEATTLHALAYNTMFIASVATILFNANPLLRFDAYYILADLLEIANLASRSRQYLFYLGKRYAWGVQQAQDPSHSPGEKFYLALYAISSFIFRIFLVSAIILTIAQIAFFVGVILALGAIAIWVVLPVGKFVRYLATSGELARVRTRAVATTTAVVLATLAGLGTIPAPDRCRLQGVVEPRVLSKVHAGASGFLVKALPSGETAGPDGAPLAVFVNPHMEKEWKVVQAREKELEARLHLARIGELSAMQGIGEQLAAVRVEKDRLRARREELVLRSPTRGRWVAPELRLSLGEHFERGEELGRILSPDRLLIRATSGQATAARLITEGSERVEIRVRKRPDLAWTGTVREIWPAGRRDLPSPALGIHGGGETRTDAGDATGKKSEENFFEIRVSPQREALAGLLPGQVVVLRFETNPRPLLAQGWRALLQLFQRKFNV